MILYLIYSQIVICYHRTQSLRIRCVCLTWWARQVYNLTRSCASDQTEFDQTLWTLQYLAAIYCISRHHRRNGTPRSPSSRHRYLRFQSFQSIESELLSLDGVHQPLTSNASFHMTHRRITEKENHCRPGLTQRWHNTSIVMLHLELDVPDPSYYPTFSSL